MPDSSDSSGTSSETAQSSLLRLTRRHSLPASTTFSTFLSLWGAENANRENRERSSTTSTAIEDESPTTSNTNYRHRASSVSGDTLLNRNGSGSGNAGLGGNRHRYGHRHTRSAAVVVDRPVIVKSYNPGPAVSRNASPLREDEDSEDLALPSIDSFSFDGILKAIDPAVTTALDAVSRLCEEYQSSLRTEVDALTDAQADIDAMMKEADKLTSRALKSTKMRTERIDADAIGLKGGTTVDVLAEAAEATHTTLTSIITTLLAIDEMLPPQERLSPLTSAHKKHYPKLHSLLADKAHEIEIRFRSIRSYEHGQRPQSRSLSVHTLASHADNAGESSSSRTVVGQDPSVWSRRRLSTSSTLLLTSPSISRSSTYSHHRGVSSPHLQLRTILPSPSTEADVPISASGSYFPIAPKTATGMSLTSPMYSAQQQLAGQISPRLESASSPGMPSKRSSGMWSRRASSGTLAAFIIRESNNGTISAVHSSPPRGGGAEVVSPAGSKPPSTWRHSAGSWAGFFGGRSSKGSSDMGKGASAEERLKMLLQGGGGGEVGGGKGGKGKGKGKGVMGR